MKKRAPLAVAFTVALALAGTATGAAAKSDRHDPACGNDSSVLFCEDFESMHTGATAGGADWGVETRNGTLTVERIKSRGRDGLGKRALHVHTEDNGYAFLTVNNFSAPANSFYGAIKVYVDEFPTKPDWAHYTLVEASGEGAGVVRPVGGQYAPPPHGDDVFWGVGSDGGPTGDWTDWRTTAPSEADRWQCIEWRMDASDNRVEVWIDGEAKPELTVDTDTHGGNQVPFVFPEFNQVKIGWQLYQGGTFPTHFDLYYDSIKLSTDRLGC